MLRTIFKIAKNNKIQSTILNKSTLTDKTSSQLALSVNSFDLLSLIQQRAIHHSHTNKQVSIFQMTTKLNHNNSILLKYANQGHTQSYIGLIWVGQLMRQLNRNIVDFQTYKQSLQKYFKYTLQSKNIQLRFFKAFCYLQDQDLKNMIKKNQIKVLKKQYAQNKLNAGVFEELINYNLFNITDLPMISELIYQMYFPNLGKLQSLSQIHKSLIYLSHFSKIPSFLPRKVFQLLRQKQEQVKTMNFNQFSQTVNTIYLLLFKFPQTLEDMNLKESFQKIFDNLLKSYLQNKSQERIDITPYEKIELITKRAKVKLQKLILQRSLQLQFYQKKLQQNKKLFQNKGQLLYQCVQKSLNQVRKLSLHNFRQLKNKTQIQFRIKSNRIILMIGSIQIPTSYSLAVFSYLKHQDTRLFYNLNRYIPDLLLSTQIVLNNIRNCIQTFSEQDKEFFNQFSNFGLTIDKLIYQDLEKITENFMADINSQKFLQIYYCEEFQNIIWLENDIQRLIKLQLNYTNNDFNFLKFLKSDPRFLIRLMKWNKFDYIWSSIKHKEMKSIRIIINKFGEGLGFTVESNDKTKQCKTFLINSEMAKNHIFCSSTPLKHSSTKPVFLRGKANIIVRNLLDLQNKKQ